MKMKTYELIYSLQQEYDKYSIEDKEVWQILFDRQMEQLHQYAHQTYLDGLDKIGFKNNKIPNYIEVNEQLKKLTGWQIEIVPRIINEKNFFSMLAEKKIPFIDLAQKKI